MTLERLKAILKQTLSFWSQTSFFTSYTADTLYGPVHSKMAVDIFKKAVDDAQKQVGSYIK